ncbi:hypothetical protein [Croceivirga thetidis]|uniref:Tetratricopeptide repeat protein n=1 Tax=Croceivirga thetidis TaxID=2721623 RepID=A0ABX1GS94_9FLAO|nr:hypothetical protein [Croceivirga thetidis]NKI32464.1 hypothetical protein [Croceivirga thetidis]
MGGFFEELKRRNVYKVATAYAISSWLLIQIANTVGPNLNFPEAVAATITKILIIGFPIVLILAWLYELTPEGFKLTKNIESNEEGNKRIGKRLNKGIIMVLALLVSLLLTDRFFFRGQTLFEDKATASIAVLPFVNFSPEKENDYMADGLTDQILDELANINGLKVPARTSSFAFKGRNTDIKFIAEQLEVNYVLEGSVRYYDGRVRIKTKLINAANGYHLWSNTYDESFDEVLDIQENISRKVAKELKVRLLSKDEEALNQRITENSEAYKLYLKSRSFSKKRDDSSIKHAIELLEEAIDHEPNFTEAHAELSFLYILWHWFGSLDIKTSDEKAKFHMDRALSLDAEKPEVLTSYATYRRNIGNFNKDSADIISDVRKAIELKPNYPDAQFELYLSLRAAEHPQIANKHLVKAVELDPGNGFYTNVLARDLFWKYQEHEKALAIAERQLAINPKEIGMLRYKGAMLASEPFGDLAEGFKSMHQAIKIDPTNRANLDWNIAAALELDLWPLAEKYARTMQLRYSAKIPIVAYFHSFMGDFESAGEVIEFMFEQGEISNYEIASYRAQKVFNLGNPKEALELFEKAYPEIANESILGKDLTYPRKGIILKYIDFLRANNQNEKADLFSDKICLEYNYQIEKNKLMDSHMKDKILLNCYYASNQKSIFLDYLEEVFFQKKDRGEWFCNMKAGFYNRFENDKEYQRLFKRIETETHRMRAEVITYLKEEGDWNPAWDSELGIN